jgi:hypothetical protein
MSGSGRCLPLNRRRQWKAANTYPPQASPSQAQFPDDTIVPKRTAGLGVAPLQAGLKARSRRRRYPSVVRITGMALGLIGSTTAFGAVVRTSKTFYVSGNLMVETGHFPSWSLIEIRKPCNSSSQTFSTVPALPLVRATDLPISRERASSYALRIVAAWGTSTSQFPC